MDSGGSFDWSTIFNAIAGILAMFIICVAFWRVWKHYLQNHDDKAAVKVEEKTKGYGSIALDAGIAMAFLAILRVAIGFISGAVASGIGSFM